MFDVPNHVCIRFTLGTIPSCNSNGETSVNLHTKPATNELEPVLECLKGLLVFLRSVYHREFVDFDKLPSPLLTLPEHGTPSVIGVDLDSCFTVDQVKLCLPALVNAIFEPYFSHGELTIAPFVALVKGSTTPTSHHVTVATLALPIGLLTTPGAVVIRHGILEGIPSSFLSVQDSREVSQGELSHTSTAPGAGSLDLLSSHRAVFQGLTVQNQLAARLGAGNRSRLNQVPSTRNGRVGNLSGEGLGGVRVAHEPNLPEIPLQVKTTLSEMVLSAPLSGNPPFLSDIQNTVGFALTNGRPVGMKVGSLLQYKEDCYGRYYGSLPRIPFSPDVMYMASTHKGSFEDFALFKAGLLPSKEIRGRRKFNLFCTQRVEIPHPRIPSITCVYLKCFISDPYVNGETTDGWLQESWVEPLTEVLTYREEHLRVLQDTYVAKVQNKPRHTKSVQELYQEIQGRRK